MNLTKKQKENISSRLEELWRQNWVIPQESIIKAMKEALSLITPEINDRLKKFACGTSVSDKVRIEDGFLYNREISYNLDPIYCARIETSFSLGVHGYRCSVSVNRSGDTYSSELINFKTVIYAATDSSTNDIDVQKLIEKAEIDSNAIIALKKRLENPPEKIFEFLASLPGKFAALVQERLEKCDEIESENLSRLLDEFGLKPKSKRRKHTVFKVNIVKEEVED